MEYNQPQEQPGLIPTHPAPQPNQQQYEPKFGDAAYGHPQSAYTATTGYQYPSTIDGSQWKRHTICGLAAATFWLLLALIIVIIAAAVGGGVGGSIAVKNAKTQCLQSNASAAALGAQSTGSATASVSITSTSSTATPTTSTSSSSTAATTATTAWGPLVTETPYTGCPDGSNSNSPNDNNTVYTSTLTGSKFQIVCGVDIPFTGTSDLLYGITPTFELCMEMCASWNSQGKSNGNVTVPCKGVAFIPTHVNGDGSGNPIDCVLKSYATGLTPNPSYNVDSAIAL